jgi:3-isopropylmalate/(R)-2-methylmalate dehydratase small subunit
MAIEKILSIRGAALPLRGANIDTDRIIPARFLRSVSFEGLEQHLFEDDIHQLDAQTAGTHPLTNPRFSQASILVVNRNFGCGSSREHAPQAIRRRGFTAVVGESFSEIFFGNSVALGMPCVTAQAREIDALQSTIEREPARVLTIDLESMTLTGGDHPVAITLPAAARESFLEGTWDATALLLDRFEQVEAVAKRLPYMRGWA